MASVFRTYLQGFAAGLAIGLIFISLGYFEPHSSSAVFLYYVLSGFTVILSDVLLRGIFLANTYFTQLSLNTLVLAYWVVNGLLVAGISRYRVKLSVYAGLIILTLNIFVGIYLYQTPAFG